MRAHIHTLFKSCLLKAAPVARQNTNRILQKSPFYAISGTFTPEMAFCFCIIAGVYIDEGISGTQAAKRPQFMQMIRQCKQGRIDMIITKSVSRFARNTVDCIKYVRELKAMGIPVIFEKEGLNTMHATSEIYLSMHGIFAQSESESLSGNVRMGKAIYNSPITLQNRSNDFTG